MAYDLEEQEQLDELKAWWKTHGNTVMWGITAVLLVFAAFMGWRYYQQRQAIEASAHYEALSRLDNANIKDIRTRSAQLMEHYAGTPYAGRAALRVAHTNYAAGDLKSARAQLEWAMNHAQEDVMQSIARLQLAAVQFEEKQQDLALKTLQGRHDASLDGLYADLRGDILLAQGKKAEARAAYAEALGKLDAAGRYHRYTSRKLDALGG